MGKCDSSNCQKNKKVFNNKMCSVCSNRQNLGWEKKKRWKEDYCNLFSWKIKQNLAEIGRKAKFAGKQFGKKCNLILKRKPADLN